MPEKHFIIFPALLFLNILTLP